MRNPFIEKPIWTLLYLLWWILPGSINSFVLWKAFNLPLSLSISDALISYLIFAIIGLSIWYMVRYAFFESQDWKKTIQMNLLSMGIIFVIWIGASYGIITLISLDLSAIFASTILWRFLLFLPVYLLLIFSYFLFSSLKKINDQDLHAAKIENLIRSAELDMLKAQINPHFLFNSLNSASSLTTSNPEKAQEMIINISDFFRYTLISSKNQFTKLETEVEHALLYLEIEKSRFGDKIQLNCSLPKDLNNVEIPSLILQPLVENAIKHGIYESTKPINIDFFFKNIGDKIKITIENEIDIDAGNSKKGTETGLLNISKRLELAYQESNLLSYQKKENLFSVTIWIPINKTI